MCSSDLYHISDLVRVTGFHNQTPLVEFLSKGAHFANLTGEKLSEYHVAGAMRDVLTTTNMTLTAYSLAPCWPAGTSADFEQPYYGLFVERGDLPETAAARLAERLDSRLRQHNIEYDAKRASRRLEAVRPVFVPAGFWQRWDRERLERSGGAPEQYKHPCLIADSQFNAGVEMAAVASGT